LPISHLDAPIVRPRKGKNAPALGPLVAMISAQADVNDLCRRFELDPMAPSRSVFLSRLYPGDAGRIGLAFCGPMIGAPYAVMIMETLAAWGASQIVFAGWCGAIDPQVAVGDIVLPSGAFIDEGTSLHYAGRRGGQAIPSPALVARVGRQLTSAAIGFHQGPVWSTDGVFRETARRVAHFKRKAVLAVEMETSALFSAGRFLGIDVAAVLVVSDSLASGSWQPGFKTSAFQQGRQNLLTTIEGLTMVKSRTDIIG
jgi:uridine phosphorylase